MDLWRTMLLAATMLFALHQQAPEPLRQAVASYWDAMTARDYATALEWVHSEDRNVFIERTHPSFRSWELGDVVMTAPDEADVRIGFEQQVQPGGPYYAVGMVQKWVLNGDRWALRVLRLTPETMDRLYGGTGPAAEPQLPVLVVAPQVVLFPFLNPRSRGWFRISNGLEDSVQVVAVDFDNERFDLVQPPPDQVAARSSARIRLEYIGTEEEKDLRSELVLRLMEGSQERVYRLTLLYNHISAATKTFFGLSDEEARNLKRGDKLTPKIKLPEGLTPPPPAVKPPAR